ncbi:outer membrane protein assembly factor BamD [Neiella marina]|uniref:Outer membrane protein assembly factor BamD n=1 Tax=Neiella marina TaxID=508461 RepID=A0A8J2U3I3_9GAMM|nr:outer membrane protein assembly factor BamD [Neiella marina]GGA70922.1 outer membrane protein assembly factor BamD [Neiella marina]
MLLSRLTGLGVLGLALVLGACSSTPEKEKIAEKPAAELYQEAKTRMNSGNYRSAIAHFEALLSRYPFGAHADQVQLDLISAYYSVADNPAALAAIDRFIRLNPTHKDIDYALYMRGLVNEDEDRNFFQELFRIDRSDRDPHNIREAFQDYERLLRDYPGSKYAPDASKRMIALKNRLARFEVMVAEYYYERDAYVAALGRGKYVLEYMPDTPSVERALEIMARSYKQLGMEDARQDTLRVLQLNYPENRMVN